jgi:hexulose-6-phosphate isomerase
MSGISITRRQLIQTSTTAALAIAVHSWSQAAETKSVDSKILKTLKIGMIRDGASLEEKFQIAKDAGFDGVELNAPGINVDETRKAIANTGLLVDGTVGANHWKIRHTSPDVAIRKQALQELIEGIEQTAAVGGRTKLLVIGRLDDGPESESLPRSMDNIADALPTAARCGVDIAIENVWNKLLYDHNGPSNQTAERYTKYVDAFRSPWVGMQFDIGNHWKYGDPAAWIRELGTRVVKLDIKGFSRAKDQFTEIAEADIDWKSVRQALRDIGFHGWCAAEVRGGDKKELTRIAREMDVVLEQSAG